MKMKTFAGLAVALLAGSALAASPDAACSLTGLQKAAGYVTFGNVVAFFAAVGVALFGGIFLYQVRTLFASIPLAVWKALGYGVSAALCASAAWMAPANAPYGQFVGAALGAGALALVLSDLADAFGWSKKGSSSWHLSVAVLGCSLALVQSNPMVAAVGVGGLMGLLGFSAFSVPGMVAMGFDSKDSLWKATFSALAILVPSVLWRAGHGTMGPLEMFYPAIGWLCSLVAGVGLLIASSRFHTSAGGALGYVARNLAMLGFGLFCVWAGSVHGMTELQRVGGTLLAVWLFEKPWDIPKAGVVGYSLLGALSCGALYVAAQQVMAHPDRWGAYLVF